MLARIRDYTEELSTAIEITQEQPGSGADPQKAVLAYAEKLRRLGVRDVSIADASAEVVQASTNPRIVGKKLARRPGPAEYVIRGVLGEEGTLGHPTTSSLTVPIVVGDRRVGYVVITRILDDFSALSQTALASRIAATLAVFALGMLLSLVLASAVSRPVQALTDAARRVAAGDLSAQVRAAGSDELGALARTFNQMVERLGESRALEERLRVAERSTAMGRFAAALAHEIRNPLNSISLTIDHVRTRLAPEGDTQRAEFQALMATLKSEVARLNRLVGDFLSTGQPARLDPRPCDVGEVVRETAALVEHKAREQAIEVELDVASGLPSTVADPELLKTCLLNLVLNAFEAMPAAAGCRSRRGSSGRRTRRRSRCSSPTPGSGCRSTPRRAPSSPTSRPRRRASGWASRSSAGSWRATAARSRSTRRPTRGRACACCCRSVRRRSPRRSRQGACAREAAHPRGRRRAAAARDPAADPGLGGLRGRDGGERPGGPRRPAPPALRRRAHRSQDAGPLGDRAARADPARAAGSLRRADDGARDDRLRGRGHAQGRLRLPDEARRPRGAAARRLAGRRAHPAGEREPAAAGGAAGTLPGGEPGGRPREHAGGLPHRAQGGALELHRAHLRGERHGQGAGGAGHPRDQRPARPAVRGGQRGRAPRDASSRRSCSATRRAPSPGPTRARSGTSSRPRARRSFSTRSES